MNETENPGKEACGKEPGSRKKRGKTDLTVEIRQYQTLLQILDHGRNTVKVALAMFALVVAIFMALAFTTIAIKRFYPYNEIYTNAFGATTMQNEEVELTYWLFNTATLWANSGIRVEKGDVLTIRASGRSNTSIHHIVDNAFNNSEPRYKWVGTEGQPRPANMRTAYRIYPGRDPDALIMQVIPADVLQAGVLPPEYRRPDFVDYDPEQIEIWKGNEVHLLDNIRQAEAKRQEHYYYIGKERTDLRVAQDGVLHFAVNDIVLTRTCIDSMMRKNNAVIDRYAGFSLSEKLNSRPMSQTIERILSLRKECDSLKAFYRVALSQRQIDRNDPVSENLRKALFKHYGMPDKGLAVLADSARKQALLATWREQYGKNIEMIRSLLRSDPLEYYCAVWRNANREAGLYLGAHPVPLDSDIDHFPLSSVQMDKESLGALQEQVYPFYNEFTHYLDQNYYQAWYDDNIGSFLIVVEKRKK